MEQGFLKVLIGRLRDEELDEQLPHAVHQMPVQNHSHKPDAQHKHIHKDSLNQGSPTLLLEFYVPADFSSN